MNIVLLSGGSGRRLWPLSNDIRSKQFIRIFKTEDGGYQSMVQRVYGQIKSVMPDADVTIATSKSQVSSIINQLGEGAGISVEPCRRDTFPAIVLAAAYLADVRKVGLQEPVVVCPVDPYVEEDYFHALKKLGEQAAAGEANLVLMGIEPTYPSEKYGYIIPENTDSISRVLTFKEKPDEGTAREYIKQGALWNGGIFAFRLSYLLDKAHELIDFSGYDDLYQRYGELEKISFDYAVVEREKSIQVMRFGGQWKDLGTWNTLSEAMEESCIGDAVLEDTCENVHVINELGMPVLALGLHDVVISASPEGILVSDKERSSHIKPFVEKISRQVMFAEKSWGSYRVLDADGHSLTIRVTLNPGKSMNYHSHRHRDEVWVVTCGHGRALIDGEVRNIRAGDVLSMPAGCCHTVFADTELKLVEVQLGEEISVSDKEKHLIRPDSRCFGGADIRGIYPVQVSEELAYRIGRYYPGIIRAGGTSGTGDHNDRTGRNGKMLSADNSMKAAGAGRIAVGCDVRLSSPRLKKSLIRGLMEAGC
ncbi:sugar phosphate nucleotidyltransferase, partial [Anaerovibrio sp.]|uniref:sugar phosphate nucleotidyltransferase n=1 Tax=Anaerovibrio sp. TaxID=1872532 RepID=UPI003F17BC85